MMKSSRFTLVPAFLIAGALFAQDAQVTPLMSKDLPECPGKEGLMITGCILPALRIRFTGTMRMHSFTCWRAPS